MLRIKQGSNLFQGYQVPPIVVDTNNRSVGRSASPVDSTVSQSAVAVHRNQSGADATRSSLMMPSETTVFISSFIL